jgi:ribonuclease D
MALLLAAAQEGSVDLAIDTEFIRENTYFSQLCLIQMAWQDHVVLIDPLALDGQLAPLNEIFQHPRITKIFHSGRQDLEIFWLLFKSLPTPLYDTQIAAMVCGYGESIAYNMLVEHLVGIPLDKASRLTDWSKRPLNFEQCEYAMADVTHLLKVYAKLKERIHTAGRSTWIEEETAELLNPALYEPNPETAWQKVRANRLKPRSVEALKVMAAFRERYAIEKNTPKTRLIKDDVLVDLATNLPESMEQLKRMRGLPPTMRNNPFIGQLMDLIAQSKKTPPPPHNKDFVQEKILPSRYEGLLDLLRMLLKIVCDQEGVAPKLVGGRHDLEQLIFHTLEGTPPCFEHNLLEGWRFDLFGKQAQELVRGQEGLFWRNGKIVSLGV